MQDFSWIEVIAIMLSPIFAFTVTIMYQERKEKRQNKLHILGVLIGNRHLPISEDVVRVMNMIDIVFYDDEKVRKLWSEYYDMLSNAGLNNELGFKQRKNKNLELIHAMAKSLGYGKAITHLDVDRVYYPEGLGKQTQFNHELSSELFRVLRSTDSLAICPKSMEHTPSSER